MYARCEETFGFGDEHLWGSYADPSHMFFIFTPTEDEPDETYQMRAYRNFMSDERTEPYKAGEVVRLVNPLGAVDVSTFQLDFK